MTSDLPIYPESAALRTGLQFADLQRFHAVDKRPIWEKSDRLIALMEGSTSVADARQILVEPETASLLRTHAVLFAGKDGAGVLRRTLIAGRFRGQDCPEPQFIEGSLENFFSWMSAESMNEIHPIEKAALVMTRIVDIWPFEIGNLTAAIVLANAYLAKANYAPFFVLPEHVKEFDGVMAKAVTIETQPLVNVIYQTIKRELQGLAV